MQSKISRGSAGEQNGAQPHIDNHVYRAGGTGSRPHRASLLLGLGILLNGMVLSVFCVLIEVGIVLLQRPTHLRTELTRHLGDGSTLLTAWLIAVCLPPDLPISVLAVAALAAIGLAKHAYGGLGQNVFNPAMVGYAVILLSFPALLASYPNIGVDSLSGATLLSDFRYRGGTTVAEFMPSVTMAQHQATVTAGLFFCGGLWLLFRRIISWRIPTAVLLDCGCARRGNLRSGIIPKPRVSMVSLDWLAALSLPLFSLLLTRSHTLQTLDIKFYSAV